MTLRRIHLLVLSACAALLGAAAGAPVGAPPTQTLYTKAIAVMSDLPQPAFVTYRLESSSDGLQIGLMVINNNVWLNIHPGSEPQRWMLSHRTYDYASEIRDLGDGSRYTTQRSFFDPTWYGAYRALREGMFYSQDPATPRPLPGGATPAPATLRTIAVISVMGPNIYNIQDRGEQPCPNGAPGHAMHLVSRNRDPHHQLSDVIVDLRSMRFCMMRFSLPADFGFHGIMEQHYADVGGYWMQTDGFLDGTLRAFGIAMHHGVWHYRLLDMQFPASLPDQTFAQAPK